MENFTPINATIGGALIGLAAVLLMAFNGRIAGISGILSGTILGDGMDRFWRIAFLLGLFIAPLIYPLIFGTTPAFNLQADTPLIIMGGLLVGFGSRLGSGCTSGHGICGLSRLSPRSLVSVMVFMATGMVTVAVVKSVMGG